MDELKSREDYLEAILVLRRKNGTVKSIDVANELNFSKPSVSIAMKKLKDKNLIVVNPDGSIELTNEGEEIATKTLSKHEFFTNLFIKMGVDPAIAEDEACKIEHSISEDTFNKIKDFVTKQ